MLPFLKGIPPGNNIREAQIIFQILGYYRGDIDGYYGPLTEEAVMKFQKANGLAVDGIVGVNTYEALQRQYP